MASFTREELKAVRPKGFPLYPGANGSWMKKGVGSLGPWGKGKPKAEQKRLMDKALKKYRVMQLERAGEDDEFAPSKLTLGQLVKKFLSDKQAMLEEGRIVPGRYRQLECVCEFVADVIGPSKRVDSLKPDDWTKVRPKMAKRWKAPGSLRTRISDVSHMMSYAYDQEWISRPVRFGRGFKAPTQAEITTHRERKRIGGVRDKFTPEEVREQVRLANDLRTKAAILVCINLGMTTKEVSALRFDDFDMETGWYVAIREKTGILREGKLWQRTRDALQAYIDGARIPPMQEDAAYVFTAATRRRMSIAPFKVSLRKLLKKCGINEPGLHSRGYRKLFATLGDATGDSDATRRVMGHKLATVLHTNYAEFDRGRIERVCNAVEQAIFGHTDSQ